MINAALSGFIALQGSRPNSIRNSARILALALLISLGPQALGTALAGDSAATNSTPPSSSTGAVNTELARDDSKWICDRGNCDCYNCDFSDCCRSRGWVSAEYLLWWTNGVRLPALITTNPSDIPSLNDPNTRVLFGNQFANDEARHGFRIGTGYWLDCDCTCALESSFFLLASQGEGLNAGSANGSRIVGRPFFNVQTGQGDAELVSFPGIVSGFINANASAGDLLGADIGWRRALCCAPCYRLDWEIGYRFFYFADRVRVSEQLAPQGATVPGTQIDLTDSFSASNQFHGGYLGLIASRNSGPWSLDAKARMDIGAVVRDVDINGQTTVSVPGFGSTTSPGGLLALSSNSGTTIRPMRSSSRNLSFASSIAFRTM
jgi:hypothetical protein